MKIPKKLFMAFWRLGWKLRSFKRGGLQVGEMFPDFSLRDLEGRAHRLSDLSQAQFTVLWFTNFCEDCQSRIPLLEELHREAGERVRILAVSILGVDDPLPRQVAPSCPFPTLLDPEDVVGLKLGLPHPPQACPFHNLFIVARSGRILFRRHLSAMRQDEFRLLWERFLLQEHPVR